MPIASPAFTRTFILGAGFSVAEQFPLVRGLKERVIHFLEAERHSAYQVFLEPGNGGFARGQFYAGLDLIDPNGTLGLEEILVLLRKRLQTANNSDPCYITRDVLRIGCARLLWCIQNSIWKVSPCYEGFTTWLRPDSAVLSNAVLSFNWDLLVEQSLSDSKLLWTYSTSAPGRIPVLKPHGSINWSGHLREGLRAEYAGWKPIAPGSKLSFDASEPLSNPNKQEINSSLRYMLFPGDPELPREDADLAKIWSEASAAINDRDVIVFIGYSMPDYDSFAAEFFTQFAGRKQIEVYNPSAEHLEKFRALFGSGVQLFAQSFQGSPYAREREASL
jgi:hypothetical protein